MTPDQEFEKWNEQHQFGPGEDEWFTEAKREVWQAAQQAQADRIATLEDQVERLAADLLEIAELAMPDTYLQTDHRCVNARAALADASALPRAEEVEG